MAERAATRRACYARGSGRRWQIGGQRVTTRLLAVLAVLAAGMLAFLVFGTAEAQSGSSEVRISARRLADERIEFALQMRAGSGWSERFLPARRYFPASSQGPWLYSSEVVAYDAIIRISARRLADGRIEFALQRRTGSGWSERVLPARRFFPTSSQGRWLNSSVVTIAARLSCVELADRLYGAVRAGRSDARQAGVPEDDSYLIQRLIPLLETHTYLGRETSGADTWVEFALSQGTVPDRNFRVFGQWVRALLAANWWHDLSSKLDLALRGSFSEEAVAREMDLALLALRTTPEQIFIPDCRQ